VSDLQDRPIPEDSTVEGHRARIQAAVEVYVQSTKTYLDKLIKLYAPQTRHWKGTVSAIQTSAKTATVTSDPFPEAGAPPAMPMGWGRATWTAGDLVGKRVRFMVNSETKESWIDDRTG